MIQLLVCESSSQILEPFRETLHQFAKPRAPTDAVSGLVR